MGYTATVLFGSVMLAPVMLAVAGLGLLIARKLGIVPGGLGAFVGYLLILCASYGMLYVGIAVDMLAVTPARLQTRYLGQAVAGPSSLAHFDQWGFQDPGAEWRYRLSPGQADALRSRCQRSEGSRGGRTCLLYSGMDDRWFAQVTLEGNQLRMTDGLH